MAINARGGLMMDLFAGLKQFSFKTNSVESLAQACENIARIKSDDVQEMASHLQMMIVHYYQDVRRQALFAFFAALVLEVVAVVFFFTAAFMTMNKESATISTISGLLIQIMTGIVFYLYSQSAKQFAGFHICLERANRFMLANSIVEHLSKPEQDSKRAEVITAIINAPMLTLEMLEKGA
jgi:hypothetical protein